MAVVTVMYNLPTDPTQLQAYAEWSGSAAHRITAAPGMVWWQPFRNPQQTAPHVLSFQVMDSLESAQKWVASEECAAIVAEMEGFGCADIRLQVWDKSPLLSEPMKP